MSSIPWLLIGLGLWVGGSTVSLILAQREYLKALPQRDKLGEPLKIWWLFYALPVILPVIFVISFIQNYRDRRQWAHDYVMTGHLFWCLIEKSFKQHPAFYTTVMEVWVATGNYTPEDFKAELFSGILTKLRETYEVEGYRVSENVAVYEVGNDCLLVSCKGEQPLVAPMIATELSRNLTSTYPLISVAESWISRHYSAFDAPVKL